jgi:hypothetical protein
VRGFGVLAAAALALNLVEAAAVIGQTPEAAPGSAGIRRWLDVQAAQAETRYRVAQSSADVVTNSQSDQQQDEGAQTNERGDNPKFLGDGHGTTLKGQVVVEAQPHRPPVGDRPFLPFKGLRHGRLAGETGLTSVQQGQYQGTNAWTLGFAVARRAEPSCSASNGRACDAGHDTGT